MYGPETHLEVLAWSLHLTSARWCPGAVGLRTVSPRGPVRSADHLAIHGDPAAPGPERGRLAEPPVRLESGAEPGRRWPSCCTGFTSGVDARGRSPGRGRPPCRDWGGPVGPLRGTAEPGRAMLHQGWCQGWGSRGPGGGPDDSAVTRLLPSGRGWGAGSPQLHCAEVGWGAVSTKERLGGAGRPSAGEHVGDSRVKGTKPGGRGWSSCGCPVGWTGICSGPPGGLASAVTARLQ